MFELIFGLFWTTLSCLFAFMMFGGAGNGEIIVNGEPMSQSEFNALLWPKLFIGLFIAVGIFMIITGIRKLIKNAATAAIGTETYGVVVDVYPSGTYVNGRPVLNADVMIVEENGTTGRYTESVGMDYNKYKHGGFVKVKHHKNDINIIEKVEPHMLPYHMKDKLDAEAGLTDNYNPGYDNGYNVGGTETADTIVINGVEYVRKK